MLTCRRRLGLPWYPVRPRRTIPAPLDKGCFYGKTMPPAAERAGCFEEAPRLAGKMVCQRHSLLRTHRVRLFSLLAAGSPILETRSVLMLRQHEGKTFLCTGIVARGKCKMDKETTFR